MRILQIHSGYSLNGAVRYAAVLSRLLASRGHEIVILQRPGLDLGSMMSLPSNIEIQSSSLRRGPGEIRRIGEFCRKRGIDAIHTHKSSAHAFGALLRLFYRVPCVATAHSLNYQLHWFVNDRVICHNEESMQFMHDWNRVPHRKLRQVPAFVDDSYLDAPAEEPMATRSALGIAEGRLMLVTIGNVERRKGILDLVDALPRVLQAGLDACLVIAGWFHSTGYRLEVEGRARVLGIAERVIWLARISDADVGRLLRATDLYVQASHVETGPLVVLEAMAVGLPVVGTICGSMPDFIVPGVTGELVPPAKPEALGDAVAGVLRHAERRREMGLQGRKRFASQFSADVNIPKIEAILAEAAGQA
jgi:glycosyltransferase involved in cell wall biosynthesis